jgi:hypothetical protein
MKLDLNGLFDYPVHVSGLGGKDLGVLELDSIAHSSLMMEAVRTSETSVDNHFTRQYIPEDNSEHQRRFLHIFIR